MGADLGSEEGGGVASVPTLLCTSGIGTGADVKLTAKLDWLEGGGVANFYLYSQVQPGTARHSQAQPGTARYSQVQ